MVKVLNREVIRRIDRGSNGGVSVSGSGTEIGITLNDVWGALALNTDEQINLSHLTSVQTWADDRYLKLTGGTINGNLNVTGTLSVASKLVATQEWVGLNYISIAFFDRLFKAYNGNTQVNANDTTSTIDNIKAMFGFWTEQYLSALGRGSDQGGGGQGDVTWALLADNTDIRPIALSHLTNALSGYATQTWVQQQGYLTSSSLSGLVSQVNVGTTAYTPVSGVVSLPAYPTVPTAVSQLTNDTGYITSSGSCALSTFSYYNSTHVTSESTFATVINAGFYRVTADSGSTSPIANTPHGNTAIHAAWGNSNTAGFDLLTNDSSSSNLYFRARIGGGEMGSWRTIIDSSNIGSQSVSYATNSGNADTLDGYHEYAFLHLTGGTITGALTVNGALTASGGILVPSNQTIKIGNAYLSWDSTNSAIRVSANADGTGAANFYAMGAVSALGAGSGGGGGLSLNQPLSGINTAGLGFPSANNVAIVWNGSAWTYAVVGSGSGTVTQVNVGSSVYTPVNGVISLPAYPVVPTAVSSFTNDAGYIDSSTIGSQSVSYATSAGTATDSYYNRTNTISESVLATAIKSGFYNVYADSGSTSIVANTPNGNTTIHVCWDDGDNSAGFDLLSNDSIVSSLYFRARIGGGEMGSWKTILDSANFSNLALPLTGGTMSNTNLVTNLNADYLDGYHATSCYITHGDGITADTDVSTYNTGSYGVAGYAGNINACPESYGVLMCLGKDALYSPQFFMNYNATSLYIRTRIWDLGSATNWHQVAFIDSTVSNATTVDGIASNRIVYGDNATKTGNVSFGINDYHPSGFYRCYATGRMLIHTSYISEGNVAGLTLFCNDETNGNLYVVSQNGDGGGTIRTIWDSGNSGTSTKSWACSTLNAGDLVIEGGNEINSYSSTGNIHLNYRVSGNVGLGYGGGETIVYGSRLQIQKASEPHILFHSPNVAYGNIRIKSNSQFYFYQGDGNAQANATCVNAGEFYSYGQVVALSDERDKNVVGNVGLSVEQIADAPAIRFLWKDGRRDNTMQTGSIAQYWQKVLPEVIREKEDRLSLSYGVAALVSAIVTARKVVDHEKIIQEHERKIAELQKENQRLKQMLNVA